MVSPFLPTEKWRLDPNLLFFAFTKSHIQAANCLLAQAGTDELYCLSLLRSSLFFPFNQAGSKSALWIERVRVTAPVYLMIQQSEPQ